MTPQSTQPRSISESRLWTHPVRTIAAGIVAGFLAIVALGFVGYVLTYPLWPH